MQTYLIFVSNFNNFQLNVLGLTSVKYLQQLMRAGRPGSVPDQMLPMLIVTNIAGNIKKTIPTRGRRELYPKMNTSLSNYSNNTSSFMMNVSLTMYHSRVNKEKAWALLKSLIHTGRVWSCGMAESSSVCLEDCNFKNKKYFCICGLACF